MRDPSRMWTACRGRGLVALGIILALLLVPSGNAFATSQDIPLAPMFSDDMESGPGLWVVDTPVPLGAPWAIVTTDSHSPTHSWSTDDPNNISDKRVALAADVMIGGAALMSFWMRYNVEDFPPTTGYDGVVLEYSLNGGTTWTDILLAQGSVPADAARIIANGYTRTISTGFASPLAGRQAWSGDNAAWQQMKVNLAAFSGLNTRFRWRFASDNSVADVGVWLDDVVITASLEPLSLAVDAAGNGVLQPNETVVMAPTWRNNNTAAVTLAGSVSNFTGPSGPTYTITDGIGNYGSIAGGGTGACTDCYGLNVTAATRPSTHLDATVRETVTPGTVTKDWTIHVGDSFSDVPPASGFYRFIETILHKNVTGGCTATTYCPTNPTTRDQMAVFVLVAKEPAGYTPAACGATPMFADVPVSSPFCKWIEELARRGVVSGCGGGNYCPTAPATREQMAIFVLRTLDPALNPPACGTPVFADVPASSPFCKWIEELARRGIVTGCGGGNYCPTVAVTREQMGVFLTATFGLTLYGI